MKLDFNIQLNQKQGLALTAQVQQAIKLLHMTNIEIQEFVSEQFQDNPFIETNDFSENAFKSYESDLKKEFGKLLKFSHRALRIARFKGLFSGIVSLTKWLLVLYSQKQSYCKLSLTQQSLIPKIL